MKRPLNLICLVATCLAAHFIGFNAFASVATEPLRYLPVQDAGRTKPLESLARETLQLIYGSQQFETPTGEKKPALEIVMTWMLVPQYWDNQKIIEISHKGLKTALELPDEQKYFTPNEVMSNKHLGLVFKDLADQRQKKEKLSPYLQASQRLETQLGTYQAFKQGQAMRVVPPTPADDAAAIARAAPTMAPMARPVETEKWITVADLKGDLQTKFAVLIRSFIQALPENEGAMKAGAGAGPHGKDPSVPSLEQAVDDFKAAARAQNPALYPPDRDIALEVHLKVFHPFLYAWIFYLLAALTMAFAWQAGKGNWASKLYVAAWVLTGCAFALHCYGFFLRMYLTGRPPVSNMYESVVWVSFGAMVFAMILETIYKRRFILIAGCIVGTICLIIGDLAPAILDQSLQPLEPVLRSNLWLTVHVLTITLSYSAFFLAWGLGNMGLGFVLRGDQANTERLRNIVQSLYRAIQVGVVLLAAGIILGGIWADYSWGRFWGWDPKETWALIALLGYLAMLHGRLVGWIRNVGMLASSVIAFNLVIMAWYGVNYVLGAGKHTYGFGAGGVQYVAAFVILNLIFVGYSLYVNQAATELAKVSSKKSDKNPN